MNCVIVEDNEVQQHIIADFIKTTDRLNLVGIYSSVINLMEKLNNFLEVDVLFLDVELPVMSGIEFLKIYRPSVHVVLITANKNYALEAFDYNVLDYLVKPVSYSRFLRAVDKLNIVTKETKSIYIKSNGVVIKLILNDILWVKSANEYLIIYTNNKKHVIYSTMLKFLEKLPQFFIRVHRSHIVNTKKIETFSKNNITIGPYQIKVSKTYVEVVTQKMGL